MIEAPCFITCALGNGTVIRGRAVAYSDPDKSSGYGGAFSWRDGDGTVSYVLWAAIAHLTVFPLSSE